MLEVDQALNRVLRHVRRLEPRPRPLADALGLALAENVKADRDLPPFDRAAMDGYAVRAADVSAAWAELDVVAEAPAGSRATVRLRRGQCARISTGAPLVAGADAVVMLERSQPVGRRRARLAGPVTKWQNVARRGEDARRNRILLPRGAILTPARMALLAMVGCAEPLVYPPPSAAVLATGNELVDPADAPDADQIRDGNSTLIEGMMRRFGLREIRRLGIARDERSRLTGLIEQGLEAGLLLISGGVSVGDYDLVPSVLAELGCDIVLHKVAMKPGKPILFASGPSGQPVFGLPGNPVAVLVTLWEFVGPAVRKMMARDPSVPECRARLRSACKKKPGRTTFLPARTARVASGLETEPIASHGSADLAAASRADSLIVLPKSVTRRAAGQMVTVHPLQDAGESSDE